MSTTAGLKRLLAFGLALPLYGCQGGFHVVGILPDGAKCILTVEQVDGKSSLHSFPQNRKVAGSFKELFVTDPTRSSYVAGISCEGRQVLARKFSYPDEVGPERELNFGKIAL